MARAAIKTIKPPVRNYCINGQFDFFQRNPTPNWIDQGNLYTADRWFRFKQGGGGPGVYTNIADAGLGNGSRAIKVGRTSGSTSIATTEIIQALETKDSLDLAGQTVTFSFKVRKGSTFSGTQVNFYLGTGTGTDQGVVSAWTSAGVYNGTAIPAASLSTTSYYQASHTVTLPSNVSQVRFDINYDPVGTAGGADYIEITEVMLNIGNFQPYVRCAGSWEAEFHLCQRYYERGYSEYIWHTNVTLNYWITQFFKVTKRTAATPQTYHILFPYDPLYAGKFTDRNGNAQCTVATLTGRDDSFTMTGTFTVASSDRIPAFYWEASAEL